MPLNLVSLILAVIFTLSGLCDMTLAAAIWAEPCQPCDSIAECEEAPKDYCVWGEARDACNRRICAKGPGDRCGGVLNMLGVCGEGMMCKSLDERCHGCSLLTMQCYRG